MPVSHGAVERVRSDNVGEVLRVVLGIVIIYYMFASIISMGFYFVYFVNFSTYYSFFC